MTRLVILAFTAACSSPHAAPDAGAKPLADAAPVDVAPDATLPPDAAIPCPAGQVCLARTPIDGVTSLPAGRLAIAWLSTTSQTPTFEVASDQPWVNAPITMVELAQIAVPSAAVQFSGIPSCTSKMGAGIAVLSTDPDGNGAISGEEIANGRSDHSIYGVHKQVIAWFSDACAPNPPDFPEGFEAGIHVYTADTPVHRLDGTATELDTCQPGSSACDQLDGPF